MEIAKQYNLEPLIVSLRTFLERLNHKNIEIVRITQFKLFVEYYYFLL